jgi:hypothetical protein
VLAARTEDGGVTTPGLLRAFRLLGQPGEIHVRVSIVRGVRQDQPQLGYRGDGDPARREDQVQHMTTVLPLVIDMVQVVAGHRDRCFGLWCAEVGDRPGRGVE